jgi:hypothetical protein
LIENCIDEEAPLARYYVFNLVDRMHQFRAARSKYAFPAGNQIVGNRA